MMRNIYEIIHICTAMFTAMITFHSHLQPQYKYELFHIYFSSFHCTGRNELNELTSLPMCGFIAQLVEHRTGVAEVTGSNPVEALIFFRLLLSNCLNWKIYCDDHFSLSNKNMLHTSCTTQAHFMHKLFVPRHVLQTDFRATARLGRIFALKNAVLPCNFGHSLDVGLPYF